MSSIRPAAVAGAFYPDDPAVLAAEVRQCLEAAAPPRQGVRAPKAIIAPHAGYMYSGPVAGTAYARIAPLRGLVSRVVLAGPAHRVDVRGAAVPRAGAFDTPLGRIELDHEVLERLRALPFVESSDQAHAQEHSLEVHLPFLARAFPGVPIVPVLMGSQAPAASTTCSAVTVTSGMRSSRSRKRPGGRGPVAEKSSAVASHCGEGSQLLD